MVAHAHLDRAVELNTALRVPVDRFEAICRKYRVHSIRLFGSALTSRFSSKNSDIDLAVEFAERLDLPWYGQVTGLMSELASLFGRPVDVIDQEHIRNRHLRDNILSHSILIFGEVTPSESGTEELMNESHEQDNRLKGALDDIIECCEQLIEFTSEKTLGEFLDDKVLQLAAERLFITIGEATNSLRKADPDAEQSINSLKEIIAMRNRLVHAYWTSDQKMLWDVIQNHVPVLRDQATQYLDSKKS